MMQRSQPQLNSLAEQDLELLSAYLDNRLGAAARVSLERRLGGDPQLQSELEALRSTVAALRSLEPAPLPRSFTLDRATVARPRAFFPLSWVMQMGSGFAGLALVLLATVQLLAVGALPAAPMAAPAAAAPTMAAAEAAPPPAAEMRLPEATAAAAATQAPASASAAAPESAPAADMSAQSPAGGAAGDAQSNSPAPVDAGSATIPSGAVQSSGSSSPGTLESALEPGPSAATKTAAPGGINPGLTLALGILLIGLALGWNRATRRRA